MPEGQRIDEFMTRNPRTLDATASVRLAAQMMQETGVGAAIVEKEGKLYGVLTDRDIVVRCIAEDADCDQTTVGEICSSALATLKPSDSVDNAIALMAKKAIRRIPVIDGGRTVGIISLGDLAMARDRDSVLGEISSAAANV